MLPGQAADNRQQMERELKMKTRILLSAALAVASVGTALAQSPSSLGKSNDSSAWSYAGSKGKICFIHSSPSALIPSSLRHGDVSFFIRTSPGEGISNEANFVVGYPFKENSTVTIDIDGQVFTMFTQGDAAWLLNAAEEPQLLTAMKAGKKMTVSGTSRRDNATSYSYSLSGVTAASNKINTECK
jgi:hypothetical protein